MSAKILVSACLLGEACRYDGGHSRQKILLDRLVDHEIISVCPEVEGGLPTPRPPAEIVGAQVLRENGEDVTEYFARGAMKTIDLAKANGVSLAILKSRSPSCGCGQVYDGSFRGILRDGDGMTVQKLKAAGIPCISDEDVLSGRSKLPAEGPESDKKINS